MTATETEIVESFETLDMTAEDISKAMDLDILAVKSILAQYSVEYRKQGRKAETLENKNLVVSNTTPKPAPKNSITNFLSPEEREMIVETMKGLAVTSDNDMVRARMCTYLFEEDKGRNEARIKNLSNMKPNGINVNVLNVNILKTRARLDKIRHGMVKDKVVDVEAVPVK